MLNQEQINLIIKVERDIRELRYSIYTKIKELEEQKKNEQVELEKVVRYLLQQYSSIYNAISSDGDKYLKDIYIGFNKENPIVCFKNCGWDNFSMEAQLKITIDDLLNPEKYIERLKIAKKEKDDKKKAKKEIEDKISAREKELKEEIIKYRKQLTKELEATSRKCPEIGTNDKDKV